MNLTKQQPHLREKIIQIGKHTLRRVGDFLAKHSLVGTQPVLDKREFTWADTLEAAYPKINQELDRVLGNLDDVPAFHQLSPDQKRISKGENWKTFAFYIFGQRVAENCAQCPDTAAVLDDLPKLQNAFFSILAPRYHIPPHRGPTRAIIRCHLGLRVPASPEACWLRVDDTICHWQPGRALFFDDTYEHEVYNNSDEVRVVLFLDFNRPMDRTGTIFNNLLLKALRASAYVKDPLANLARWNATHPHQK